MTLSKKQVNDICMLNKGSLCCKYLGVDDVDFSKFHCLKHKLDIKNKIDEITKKHVSTLSTPSGQSIPMGNNCNGYPILKNIEQGYDI